MAREVFLKKLVKDCSKGRSDARRELYELYASRFMGLCYRYAKSVDDAEDIFQDGFIKVFENLHTLKNPDALEAWMKRIFVNEALKFIGRNNTFMMVDYSYAEMRPIEDFGVIDKLAIEDMTAIIRRLPDKMRIAFNMYAIEGYSHAEIAESLNISVGTSKSNLHDARVYIQKEIAKLNIIKCATAHE
ncbi:MAG: RNA polymerase sigma factor [Imperialibacter sp.]|uniref:RNA polymerase sigma factor n=1 Tax=Imperialibacter sp. TaxID=2038411 RepID=UPI0032EF10E0